MATFPHVVQTSYATIEGLTNLPQFQNNPTPLLILIEEQFTGSLIRLAATQLELTQELTALEFYIILHHPAAFSNLSMQHLSLILQLNSLVSHSLQQILDMQGDNQSNEGTTVNEKDHIEDRVFSQMQTMVSSPTTDLRMSPRQ